MTSRAPKQSSLSTINGIVDVKPPWILKWGMVLVIVFLFCVITVAFMVKVRNNVTTKIIVQSIDKNSDLLGYIKEANALIVQSKISAAQFSNIDMDKEIFVKLEDIPEKNNIGKIKLIIAEKAFVKDSVRLSFRIADFSNKINIEQGSIGTVTFIGKEKSLLHKIFDEVFFNIIRQLRF